MSTKSDQAHTGLCAAVGANLIVGGCGESDGPPLSAEGETKIAPVADAESVPEFLEMGGAKSVTSFFITSTGVGRGGDLGGLAGADDHCQALVAAEYAGDHTWRAYLGNMATTDDQPAVNARDRIGTGPWYNAEGLLVAANVEALHGDGNRIAKALATTEGLDPVNGVGATPNMHDILTGSQADGTAFAGREELTCGNWASSDAGRAQVGHHDRMGRGESASSWNSAHPSSGCSQEDLQSTGGAGLFYCFAIDCTASGFLDSGLTVFASTPPRPARGGRVAPGPGFGSRTSPASSARCTSA